MRIPIRAGIGAFLAFHLHMGFAQETFSEPQLMAFAEVYMLRKEIVLPCDTMIRQHLAETSLSESRYGEILRTEIEGGETKLTPEEISSLEFLKARNLECDEAHTQKIHELCDQRGLDFDIYTDILKIYRSRVAFQRQLQPHLVSAIQLMKNR